ncbi:MAG: hypothetical protein CUN55_20180, partial [Phototrophicales bacterium]
MVYRQHTRGYVFNYSIDFTGGTQIMLRFDHPVNAIDVKRVVAEKGWRDAIARDLSAEEVLVRVKDFSHDAKGLGDRLRDAIDAGFPEYSVELLQSESVGPGVGNALRWKSIRAVFIALIAMLL